jgi:hypothetical protein
MAVTEGEGGITTDVKVSFGAGCTSATSYEMFILFGLSFSTETPASQELRTNSITKAPSIRAFPISDALTFSDKDTFENIPETP